MSIHVYIAGAISKGDQMLNIRAACAAAHELREAGFVPFVPHLNVLWHFHAPRDYEDWLAQDFAWIARCDALLRLPGESAGADREVAFAVERRIPVFTDICGCALGGVVTSARRTIGASDNAAVLGGVRAKNNGRYNGNGRHWETPPEIFEPLNREFSFTLDPCATSATAKCAQWIDEATNGLTRDWGTHRVFMNPPYGREIYAWTRKARESAQAGALVVGLLPASTDLKWWHEDVIGPDPLNPFAEVRYIRGRVRFITGGPYRASGFFASVIAVWRPL